MNEERTGLQKFFTWIAFAGPSTVAFLTVIVLPFLFGVFLTFTNWDGIASTFDFVGVQNYIDVFRDKGFWESLILTIKYVAITVILTNALAFLLAMAVTSKVKGENFFRAGFFIPNLIGGIVLGFIWQFVFSNVLTYIGKSSGLHLLSSSWLADPHKAFWALVIVSVWQTSGYMMIIYIAGLMNVPKELVEAATIDGANWFQRLRGVVIPMMMPSITICLFLTMSRGFMVYELNLALTKGGPFHSTELIAMHVYNEAFLSQHYGLGQSKAFFLFILVTAVSLLQVHFTKRMEVDA